MYNKGIIYILLQYVYLPKKVDAQYGQDTYAYGSTNQCSSHGLCCRLFKTNDHDSSSYYHLQTDIAYIVLSVGPLL